MKLIESHEYTIRTHGRDGGRFVELFRRCWGAIPDADRQTILEHWGRCSMGPSFELSNLWGDSAQSHAQVRANGYQMRFNADSFEIIPEGPALFIIAHEIAHVHGWASGKSDALFRSVFQASSDEADVLQRFESENEAIADALAVSWGFDKVSLDTLKLLAEMEGFESACNTMVSERPNHPMQPSGEVGRLEVDDQPSPKAARSVWRHQERNT